MESTLYLFLFLHLGFLLTSFFHLVMATDSFFSSTQSPCHADDSSALLQLKQTFSIDESASADPSAHQKVASWKLEEKGRDCCFWDGVECDETTGHVIGLDLSSSFLLGSINSSSSLFRLVHLRRLSLADNDFNASQIPSKIGHLSRLTSLNLSHSLFLGQIPAEISKLSKLVSLDLSSNVDSSFSGLLKLENPGLRSLLQNLTHIKELDLSKVNISSKVPGILANLSSLTTLRMKDCGLHGKLPTSIFQLPQLRVLSMRHNLFTGHLPEFNRSAPLEVLNLASNSFSGELPDSIGNLNFLSMLYLDSCNFSGSLPASFSNLTQLSRVELQYNSFSGQIPSLVGLSQLRVLSLSSNEFHGGTLVWLGKLTKLTELFLDGTDLYGSIPSCLANLTQPASIGLFCNTTRPKLKNLGLNSCNLREFPDFLRFQDELEVLDLGNNTIHGRIPAWMLNTSTETLGILSLSENFLAAFEQHPDIFTWPNLGIFDISYNMLQGPLPIPPPSTLAYYASDNRLTGKVPPLICQLSSLYILDLSNNNLTGTIPPCLSNFSDSLSVLDLGGNNFHGPIPQTYNKGNKLEAISFSQNQLQGKLPRSLANCTLLVFLDLSNNLIEDTFPFWLGGLSELQVLLLRSNKFYGAIGSPGTKLEFPNLRIIDLSRNGFTGDLPAEYLQNWNAMRFLDVSRMAYMWTYTSFQVLNLQWISRFAFSITITNKGVNTEYQQILNIFTAIDLSSNKFEGEIPESVGDLKGLQLLNLSNNDLSGGIPSSLRNLTNLESLDLSQNKLSGEIPQQLAALTFLEFLNVSHNHLTGPVPKGKQFDTFQNDSYEGNSGLCGEPLSRKCENLEVPPPLPPPPPNSEESRDSALPSAAVDWIVIFMGYGSGIVVGIVIGQTLTTRYHQWFIESFGRKKHKQRREKRRGRGN